MEGPAGLYYAQYGENMHGLTTIHHVARTLLHGNPKSVSLLLAWAQVFEAVEQGDYQYASMRLNKAQSIIDKNVKRNIMHKNTAARRKSLLTMKVKALEGAAAAPAPAAESPAEEA